MKKWVRNIWRQNKEWMKQRLAVVLCVTMLLQVFVPYAAVPQIQAFGAESGQVIDLKAMKKGHPNDAFESLKFTVADTVTDGNYLRSGIEFALNDSWLESQRDQLEAEGMLAKEEFLYEEDYQDLCNQFDGDYEAYLVDFLNKHSSVEVPYFTFTINKEILNVGAVLERINAHKTIVTDQGITIGTWEARETDAGLEFRVQMTGNVFGHSEIQAGLKFDLILSESYDADAGAELDKENGAPDADVKISVSGIGVPTATSSDFVMTKKAEQGKNYLGENDPSAINYTITVKASDSNAKASDSNAKASDSNVSASSSNTSAGTAAAAEQDLDDGDDENDSNDEIELINDLFDWFRLAPTKSHYVKQASGRQSSSNAAENILYGKQIADYIRGTLTLDAVECKVGTGDWIFLDPADYGYETWEAYLEANDRIFSYEIGDEIGSASEMQIKLYTRIADALWEEYGSSGKLNAEFPNQAALKDGTKTIAVSNKVEPEIHWDKLVEKDGFALDVNSSVYQWKVSVNSHLSSNANLYVIDVIRDVEHSHSYLATDSNYPVGIDLKQENGERLNVHMLSEEDLDMVDPDWENWKYENMTAEQAERLLRAVDPDGMESGNAYIYTYSDTKKNWWMVQRPRSRLKTSCCWYR